MADSIGIKKHQVGAHTAPAKSTATILLVDDDSLVLEFLSDYLKDDYCIVTASSGEEAISRMGSHEADIALVDIKMPGMDGLETIEKLNAIDQDLVTIIMTGFPTVDSSVRAIKLGASDYILKPFKLNEVSRSISMAVAERELRREMKHLKERVSMLERGIASRRDNIKVNKKLNNA